MDTITDIPFALSRIPEFPEGFISLLHDLAENRDDAVQSTVSHLGKDESWTRDVAAISSNRLQIPELAIATAVRRYVGSAFVSAELSRYWRYSLACANACAELSRCMGLSTPLAFSCGLLHDVGRLALITAYPEKYANLFATSERASGRNEIMNVAVQERILFGFDRFQTGEWLVNRWGLPPFFREIVGKFRPNDNPIHSDMVSLTKAGCRAAYSLGYGLMLGAPRKAPAEISTTLPPEVREQFGDDLLGLQQLIDERLDLWSKLLLQ